MAPFRAHLEAVLGSQVDLVLQFHVLPVHEIGASNMPGHARDDVAVKRELDHFALPVPEIALAHHNAVAEQDALALDADAFGVIAVMGDTSTRRTQSGWLKTWI